jgi:hypothetical protein
MAGEHNTNTDLRYGCMKEEGCVKKHMSYFTTPTDCSIMRFLTVDLQTLNIILKQRPNSGWASKIAAPGADDRGEGNC